MIKKLKNQKIIFRQILDNNLGDTTKPEVVSAITELAALNPTPWAAESVLNIGKWNLISAPNFLGQLTH